MAASSDAAGSTWTAGMAETLSKMGNAGETFSQVFGLPLAGRVLKACSISADRRPSPMEAQAAIYSLVGQLRLKDLENTIEHVFSDDPDMYPLDPKVSGRDPKDLSDTQLMRLLRHFQGEEWLPPPGEEDVRVRGEVLEALKPHRTEGQLALIRNEMRLGAILNGALHFKAKLPANQYLATAEYLAHSLVKMPLKPGMLTAAIDPLTMEPRLWTVVSGVDRDGFGAFFLIPRQNDLRQIIFLGRGTDPHSMLSIQGNLAETAGSGRCDDFDKDLKDAFTQAMLALGPGEPFVLDCYGHSQGGAICSLMVSRLMSWADEFKQTVSNCNLITFMAPGISKAHARPFLDVVASHPDTDFSILHVRCQATQLKNKDIVPTLGEVRLGMGCEGFDNVDTFLQTWKAPTEFVNAHKALIFDRTEEQDCLASYANISEHVSDIEAGTALLEQHLVHSLHKLAGQQRGQLERLSVPDDIPTTAAELKALSKSRRRSKRKTPVEMLQLLLMMLPEKLDGGTPRAWQILMEEANHLKVMLDRECKSWLELRMKMQSTSHSKAGVIFDKTFGKVFDGAKQSLDEVSSPSSSTADRAKGGGKLLAGGVLLAGATILSAPVTLAVVGGGATATIVAGQGVKKWDKKQAKAAFRAEHALSYELIALTELALPVLDKLSK